MKYNLYLKPCLLVIFLFLTNAIPCQSTVYFDFNEFTINDSTIKDLNIDEITDMLGRPTATNNNPILSDIVDVIGAQIYYHDIGMMFWFKPKSTDPQSRILNIEIYLVKTWDKDHNEFFQPFPGNITPKVNPNMKINNLLSIFNEHNPTIRTAEETRKSYEEMMKGIGMKVQSTTSHDFVDVLYDKGKIVLACEELTKFLESIIIVPK